MQEVPWQGRRDTQSTVGFDENYYFCERLNTYTGSPQSQDYIVIRFLGGSALARELALIAVRTLAVRIVRGELVARANLLLALALAAGLARGAGRRRL